jgi:hypothetical protein
MTSLDGFVEIGGNVGWSKPLHNNVGMLVHANASDLCLRLLNRGTYTLKLETHFLSISTMDYCLSWKTTYRQRGFPPVFALPQSCSVPLYAAGP